MPKPKNTPAAPTVVSKKAAAQKIVAVAQEIHADIIKKHRKPSMEFPIRSLQNVKYDVKRGHFEILGRTATRTLEPRPWLRLASLVAVYAAIVAGSFVVAYQLRGGFDVAGPFESPVWSLLLPVVVCKLLLLASFGQFRSVLGYFGRYDFGCIAASGGIVSVMMLALSYFSAPMATPPRSVIFIDFMLTTGGLTAVRQLLRLAHDQSREVATLNDRLVRRIGIIGAGDLGSSLVCELLTQPGSGLQPVLFIEDDPHMWNRSLHGVPILGPISRLPELVRLSRITEAIIALPGGPPGKVKEVLDLARVAGIKASFAPSFTQWTSDRGGAKASPLRSRIFLSPPHMGPDEWALVQEAFASNWIAPIGPHVDAFEQEFAARHGFAHAAALTCGTAAAHLGLRLMGVNPGDEVFCSSLTFVASVTPALMQGARPTFIDSDLRTWNMDPNRLEEALRERARVNRLPKAVIVVDLYGQCADYGAITELCARYEVPILEDAAEALGATCLGRPAGAFGRCAIFSFNGNKIITTSSGGMLVSDDEKLIREARFLATQARDPAPYYQHSQWGYNYRMSNVLAAVGRGQLRVLDQRVAARRRNFELYHAALADLPGIVFMPEADFGRSSRWLTCITIDPAVAKGDSEKVRLALEAADIESRPVWKPLHLQPVFQKMGCMTFGGEVAEKLFAHGLCLPSGSSLAEEELNRVVRTMRTALGAS